MRQFLMSGSRWRGVETGPPRSPRHSSTLPMRRERKRCGTTRRQQLGSHRRRWTELPVVLADSRARRPLTLHINLWRPREVYVMTSVVSPRPRLQHG
jgi:hypothetical protein